EHVVAAVDAHGCVGRHRARVVDRAIDEGTVFIADPLGIAARGVDGEPARGLVPGVDNDGDVLIFQHDVVAGLALYRLRAGRRALAVAPRRRPRSGSVRPARRRGPTAPTRTRRT